MVGDAIRQGATITTSVIPHEYAICGTEWSALYFSELIPPNACSNTCSTCNGKTSNMMATEESSLAERLLHRIYSIAKRSDCRGSKIGRGHWVPDISPARFPPHMPADMLAFYQELNGVTFVFKTGPMEVQNRFALLAMATGAQTVNVFTGDPGWGVITPDRVSAGERPISGYDANTNINDILVAREKGEFLWSPAPGSKRPAEGSTWVFFTCDTGAPEVFVALHPTAKAEFFDWNQEGVINTLNVASFTELIDRAIERGLGVGCFEDVINKYVAPLLEKLNMEPGPEQWGNVTIGIREVVEMSGKERRAFVVANDPRSFDRLMLLCGRSERSSDPQTAQDLAMHEVLGSKLDRRAAHVLSLFCCGLRGSDQNECRQAWELDASARVTLTLVRRDSIEPLYSETAVRAMHAIPDLAALPYRAASSALKLDHDVYDLSELQRTPLIALPSTMRPLIPRTYFLFYPPAEVHGLTTGSWNVPVLGDRRAV